MQLSLQVWPSILLMFKEETHFGHHHFIKYRHIENKIKIPNL